MNYKRLTSTNREEYDPELDFCTGCKYYGEPSGCNRPDGTCDSYDRFIETYQRLEALEDKIENGTLIELLCKPGDTVYSIWSGIGQDQTIKVDTVWYFTVRDKVYITTDYIEEGELGVDVFLTEKEAEKKLKELKGEE